MTYKWGRFVLNTFSFPFPLIWVDLVRSKGRVTLAFDLLWVSLGIRLKR